MRYFAPMLLWLVAASLPAAEQPNTPPVGDSRIAGGVLTESGEGIGGASVTAVLFTGQPHATARYTATTGPDGGYVIEQLPPGRYNVIAEKPGYSYLRVQPGRMGGHRNLDLDSSSTATGIDIVLRRTGSIAGRVTRPDGTPVEQARVMSQVRYPNGRMIGTGPPVVTDAAGRYRLTDVPPGTYAITASYSVRQEMIGRAVPGEHQDWARTFHPAATEFERATPITIQGGERLENIDITLQPEILYSVAGVITADKRTPLRNMHLEYSAGSGSFGVLTHIAEDGRFSIGGIRGPVTLVGIAETDDGTLIGLEHVQVVSSMDGVRITLGPPASVHGRVIFAGTPPPQDTPLQVQLATEWVRPRPNNERPDAAHVGADGRFSIGNVIGERRIVVLGLMPPWDVKELRRGGRAMEEGRLTLASGEIVDDLEIVIAKNPNW